METTAAVFEGSIPRLHFVRWLYVCFGLAFFPNLVFFSGLILASWISAGLWLLFFSSSYVL